MQTALATKTNETTARFYACYSQPQRYMKMATEGFLRQAGFCMSITGNRRMSGVSNLKFKIFLYYQTNVTAAFLPSFPEQ